MGQSTNESMDLATRISELIFKKVATKIPVFVHPS